MIAALSKGFSALQEPAFSSAAEKSADFILQRMRTASGRLQRRYRLGHIAYPGYLDDYACFIWGLIELYEATFNPRYLAAAVELHRIQIELFWDESSGGFFMTAKDGEELIARPKDLYDGAVAFGKLRGLFEPPPLGKDVRKSGLGKNGGADDPRLCRLHRRVSDGLHPPDDRARLPFGPDPGNRDCRRPAGSDDAGNDYVPAARNSCPLKFCCCGRTGKRRGKFFPSARFWRR